MAVIFVCVTAWLGSLLLITNAVLEGPYIGTVFTTAENGPGIVAGHVRETSPAALAGLEKGTVIRAIAEPLKGSRMVLSDVSGVHERSETGTYENWSKVTSEKGMFWRFLNSGNVLLLELETGSVLSLKPGSGRNLSTIPHESWIALVHSLLVLLICVAIAVYALPSVLINLLYLSGLSLSANILCNAFRASEELTFSPELSGTLYVVSNVSALVFAYGLLALLWHTPRPPTRFPFARFALGFAILAFLNQHFQVFAFPIHPFQFPYLLAITIAVILAIRKWIRSSGNPIDRATLSWVLLSIFVAVIPWVFVFSLPIVFGQKPLISPVLSGLILTLVFIGFGLGAFKYRLFGMRLIWRRSIVWLAVGICVLVIHLVLLSALAWTPQQALTTAVLVASWVYFPLKTFIDTRLVRKSAISVEQATRTLFENLASIPDLDEFDGRFVRFLRDLFRADNVEIIRDSSIEKTVIRNDGLSLHVSAAGKPDTFVLTGRNAGRSLFSVEDRKVADVLTELASGIYKQKSAEFEQRTNDRIQIVRDLHDDVGAKLLNLIYAVPDDDRIRGIAEQALKALKDSFMTIEDFEDLDLEGYWADIWERQNQRMLSAGLETRFVTDFAGARFLGARDLVNLKRILEEHVSNILKYADRDVAVEGSAELRRNGDFVVQLRNGLSFGQTIGMPGGRGFDNMRARARECSAEIKLLEIASENCAGGDAENHRDGEAEIENVTHRTGYFDFFFRLPLTA